MWFNKIRTKHWLLLFAGILAIGLVAFVGLVVVVSADPAAGANGSDILRAVIGDRATAAIEGALFQVQDAVQRVEYGLGLAKPSTPWQVPSAGAVASSPKSPAPQPGGATGRKSSPLALVPNPSGQTGGMFPVRKAWQPAPLSPLGGRPGEGIWTPYLQDSSGRTVAYRAFLVPDANRPYAIVAVVAFDLSHTRLHFVLGYKEPYSPDGPKRSGAMPPADKQPGVLLAMFNGGFKANNGHYGAMADGVQALPPIPGLGTVAIYKDGQVRIGAWGHDLQPSADMLAWRQNGPLVIQDGRINPMIYNDNAVDWGYTFKGVVPTWRSGIGISPDGGTLYYFAGPSLSVEALANCMQDAGVSQAIQLDINNYWVFFAAIHWMNGKPKPDPLFPQMDQNTDRYLYPYERDFFYVTAKP